jgi:hypothetical protein
MKSENWKQKICQFLVESNEELKGKSAKGTFYVVLSEAGIHFRMISTTLSITSLSLSILRLPTRHKTRWLFANHCTTQALIKLMPRVPGPP